MTIEIVYEVSNLGLGYIDSKSRAGIFRYVESILEHLTLNAQLDWKLTSYTNFYNAIFTQDYLISQRSEWSSKFFNPYNSKIVSTQLYLKILNDIHKNESRDLLNRAKRKAQSIFLDFLSFLSTPYNSNHFFDIFHSFYHSFPAKNNINATHRILTIYDIIPILMPVYFQRDLKEQFYQILKSIDINDDWCICISQSTKNDFCEFLKMSEDRVFVTHLAASNNFYQQQDKYIIHETQKKYNIPECRYILGLSTIEPRKNTKHLIECFYNLIQQQHFDDLYLVLVGAKGWLYDEVFATANSNPILRNKIIFTGYVENQDLSSLYSGATLFVYPSFYEGFGLPPLEAMQCGVPVITSNASSLPEVIGDAGIMVDPKDGDSLCQAMLNVLTNELLRISLKDKSLERAKQFSWSKCAAETVEIYKKIAN